MKKTNKNMTLGMSIGMCIGTSIGLVLGQSFFNSSGVGMCFGLSIGMSLGMTIGALKDNEINSKAQETGYEIKKIQNIEETESYHIVIEDKDGVEKTVVVSESTMAEQQFSVGDIVFEEEGIIEQAFDKEENL